MGTFIFLLFVVAFVVLPIWVLWKKRELRRQVLVAAGLSEGEDYAYFNGQSAIALNRLNGTITVAEKWSFKTYRFEQIRGWRATKVNGGHAHMTAFGGVGGTMQNAGNALLAKAKADALTGFFVEARDVDHPLWQVQMMKERDQARWMEILQQEINERAP